ncbi:unnamed protein product [Brassica oleracea var. botrytis]
MYIVNDILCKKKKQITFSPQTILMSHKNCKKMAKSAVPR